MIASRALEQKGWGFIDNLFSDYEMKQIISYGKTLELKKANIVKSQPEHKEYRGDSIHWFEWKENVIEDMVLNKFEILKTQLNEYLFLGINDFESHLAHYPEGKCYGKHFDATKQNNKRVISLVTYLNHNWKVSHGGELKLYTSDGEILVPPCAGTTILFVSSEIEHEVLKTNKDRWSIATWFTRNQ
jgi:SM-20-related protein